MIEFDMIEKDGLKIPRALFKCDKCKSKNGIYILFALSMKEECYDCGYIVTKEFPPEIWGKD